MWKQLHVQFTLMKSYPVIPCSVWGYHEYLTCHKNQRDSHHHQSWLTAAHSLHKKGQLLTVQSLLAAGTQITINLLPSITTAFIVMLLCYIRL